MSHKIAYELEVEEIEFEGDATNEDGIMKQQYKYIYGKGAGISPTARYSIVVKALPGRGSHKELRSHLAKSQEERPPHSVGYV